MGMTLDTEIVRRAVKQVVPHGEVKFVRTVRHFGFVYFKSRAALEKAIKDLDGESFI